MTKRRERESAWVLPFPRLRFRLRKGFWCQHEFSDPVMIDDGWRKLKRCTECEYAVIFP